MIRGLALPMIALRGVERGGHALNDVSAMSQRLRNAQQFFVRNFYFH